jgi:surfeit locus 1 family protein
MALNRRAPAVLLAALAGAALTARLGVWQLERAGEKIRLQHALVSRHAMPALSAAELARAEKDVAAQTDRRVTVRGRWLPALTIYLENRPMDDRTGFYAVTPLQLDDGTAVLVERGWLPRDPADFAHVSAPPPPTGQVTVQGHVTPRPGRLFEFGTAGSGPIRQNLDPKAYARETALVLRPLTIVQEDDPLASQDGLLRDWPQPAANVQMHYGYAFQWFSMSALIIGLYVWFQLIRPRRARQR